MNGSTTRDTNGTTWLRGFPIFRALIAMVVVPIATVAVPEMIGEAFEPKSPWGDNSPAYLLLWVPAAALYLAIPGYVVFLILGIPTLYLLYRWNRLGLGWFMLFGALYTALPFPFFGLHAHGNRTQIIGSVEALMSIYGPIGILGGILTRLIVFGWR